MTFGEGDAAKRFGVILGKVTEGGRFARAVREGRPGEAVFVIPEASVNRLAAPLGK